MTQAESSATARSGASVLRLPDSLVGYVANDLAVITGIVHLLLVPQVLGFSQTLAVLFALNGLGFLGGVALYLTAYWRRELFVVAGGYALVTFLAFFVYGGFDGFLSAFYMGGSLNWNAVGAKTAEVLLTGCALYLYANADS